MEIQVSRTRARVSPNGEPFLLLEQNRAHWDLLLIQRGLATVACAQTIGIPEVPTSCKPSWPHATPELVPPKRPTGPASYLYTELVHLTPSPVIELNRAVAVSMVHGTHAALDLVEALATAPSLDRYHLLSSVRADLLKLNRPAEARHHFEQAAALTQYTRERALLPSRADACKTK